jgi:hypothetical protein
MLTLFIAETYDEQRQNLLKYAGPTADQDILAVFNGIVDEVTSWRQDTRRMLFEMLGAYIATNVHKRLHFSPAVVLPLLFRLDRAAPCHQDHAARPAARPVR